MIHWNLRTKYSIVSLVSLINTTYSILIHLTGDVEADSIATVQSDKNSDSDSAVIAATDDLSDGRKKKVSKLQKRIAL